MYLEFKRTNDNNKFEKKTSFDFNKKTSHNLCISVANGRYLALRNIIAK